MGNMEPPFGLFASNDLLAAGALKAARQLGLVVPRDVAIVGFDDGDLAQAMDISTIRQPIVEADRAGFRLLEQRMRNGGAVQELKLGLELVQRATT